MAIAGKPAGIGRHLQRWQGRAEVGSTRFAADGFYQLIQRIVAERTQRLGALVFEKTDRLGGIFNAQHITDRIILVTQVLKYLPRGFLCLYAKQSAVLRGVFTTADYAVSSRLLFDLAGRIVVNTADEGLFGLPGQLQAAFV
ncbi:hypothetical protein D3C85_786380 [compost metagenome]